MKWREFIRKSFLKPGDIIIIVLLMLLSFTPIIIFQAVTADQSEAVTYQAIVKVDGKILKTFDLKEDQDPYTYTYEDPDGDYNLIEIAGSRVRISEASCDDQVCVRQGWIAKAGQSIVCLPHKLVIEIQASDGSEEGELIY